MNITEMQNNGCVIVETRMIDGLDAIIQNHLDHLPSDWGLTIFCSDINYEYLSKRFPNAEFLLIENEITIDRYNELLTSKLFWESFSYDHVLIFQSDSLLLRNGIEEFLKYDYVGAPWRFQDHGGNGGLSLRSRKVMLDILSRHNYSPIYGNEDIFFCNIIHKEKMNLAPRHACFNFSTESIYYLGSFGVHAIWKWLTKEETSLILNQYNNE